MPFFSFDSFAITTKYSYIATVIVSYSNFKWFGSKTWVHYTFVGTDVRADFDQYSSVFKGRKSGGRHGTIVQQKALGSLKVLIIRRTESTAVRSIYRPPIKGVHVVSYSSSM